MAFPRPERRPRNCGFENNLDTPVSGVSALVMIQIVHKIKIFDHRYVTILKRLFWPKQKHWDANELRIPQNTTSLRRLCNGSVPNVLDIEKNTLENQHFSAQMNKKSIPSNSKAVQPRFYRIPWKYFPTTDDFPPPILRLFRMQRLRTYASLYSAKGQFVHICGSKPFPQDPDRPPSVVRSHGNACFCNSAHFDPVFCCVPRHEGSVALLGASIDPKLLWKVVRGLKQSYCPEIRIFPVYFCAKYFCKRERFLGSNKRRSITFGACAAAKRRCGRSDFSKNVVDNILGYVGGKPERKRGDLRPWIAHKHVFIKNNVKIVFIVGSSRL